MAISPVLLMGIVLLVALLAGTTYALIRQRKYVQSLQYQRQVVIEKLEITQKKLDSVIQLTALFAQATQEDAIIKEVLKICRSLIGATAATYIPLDNYGQPLSAVSLGQLPDQGMEAWLEYLASASIRNECNDCKQKGLFVGSCPLLNGPSSDVAGLFCLPISTSQHEFGILNLYLPDVDTINGDRAAFLNAILHETALALENLRLQQQEVRTLQRMQQAQQKTDLPGLLASVLEELNSTMESDFSIALTQSGDGQTESYIAGDINPLHVSQFEEVIHAIKYSRQPSIGSEPSGNSPSDMPGLSYVAAPLITPRGESIGALLAASRHNRYSQRQLQLVQTIAGQTAALIENTSQLSRIEYETIVAERLRMAREIHDGLAQTLAFLKLQTAQMMNYLNRNDFEKLKETLSLAYDTLTNAYIDVRATIDGLRISQSEDALSEWIDQSLGEFAEQTGIAVSLAGNPREVDISPEIQIHLVSILQEALNNVRKHSGATRIEVKFQASNNELLLQLCDDGRGFEPGYVMENSHYGLRGMRERAELIGADFQVKSIAGEGTLLSISLPLTPNMLKASSLEISNSG